MPQKKHNFTRTEIQAGIMVVLAAVALAGFIAVIKGYRPPVETETYYTTFTKIIGLELGADVTYGGLTVGRVTDIRPHEENQTLIRVDFEVAPGIPINEKSQATIEQVSLTAPKHLEISTGEEEAARLEPGAQVEGKTLSGGFIELPDLQGVVSDVEVLLDDVIAFLGVEEAQQREAETGEEFVRLIQIAKDVEEALNEGQDVIGSLKNILEKQEPNIDAIVERVLKIEDSTHELVEQLKEVLASEPVNNTLSSVENVMADAEVITGDVKGIVDNLANRLEELMDTLQSTLENADGLSANARSFLENNRPVLEDMLLDLRDTVRYLRTFTRTLSEQPQSIIRGRAPEGRQH